MQEDPARPYHHGDLKRVVIETAQAMLREDKGWQFTLREALIAARPASPKDLREALAPIAETYLGFGKANPALYKLMFGAEAGEASAVHLNERALGAFEIVVDVLESGQKAGRVRKRPVRGQAAACWALLHGLAMLSIDGLLLPEKVGDNAIEAALGTLLEGLESRS